MGYGTSDRGWSAQFTSSLVVRQVVDELVHLRLLERRRHGTSATLLEVRQLLRAVSSWRTTLNVGRATFAEIGHWAVAQVHLLGLDTPDAEGNLRHGAPPILSRDDTIILLLHPYCWLL